MALFLFLLGPIRRGWTSYHPGPVFKIELQRISDNIAASTSRLHIVINTIRRCFRDHRLCDVIQRFVTHATTLEQFSLVARLFSGTVWHKVNHKPYDLN